MEIRKGAYIIIILIFVLTLGLFLSTRMLYQRINEIEYKIKVYDLIGKTLEEVSAGFWKLRTLFSETGKYDFSLYERILKRFNKIEDLFKEVNLTEKTNKEMIEQYRCLKIYLRQYKDRAEDLRKLREELDFMDTELDSVYSSTAFYVISAKQFIPLQLFYVLERAYMSYRIMKTKENFLALENAIDAIIRQDKEESDITLFKEYLESLKGNVEKDFSLSQKKEGIRIQLDYAISRFEKFLALLEGTTEEMISTTTQALSRKREGGMFMYLVFMAITITSFVGFILLFLKEVLFSIGNLSKVVESVTKGNLSIRFFSSSKNELSQFGFAFNEMLEKIEKMTQRLEEEKEKVKRADALKGEFLKMMSHELRTPLNSIIGFSEVLSETGLSNIQKEYLDIIMGQSEKLKDVLDMMLEFSLLARGMSEEVTEKFSIIATIEDAIDKNIKKAEEKGLSIRFEPKIEVPELLVGNPYAVFKIFDALLDNGIKFTKKGYVEVGITEKRPEENGYITLYFYVKDTGIGIPEEKREEIFESFFQIEPVLTREYSGIGIGLAIVKRLVEETGGKIWVESTPGKGTTFYLTLKFKTL